MSTTSAKEPVHTSDTIHVVAGIVCAVLCGAALIGAIVLYAMYESASWMPYVALALLGVLVCCFIVVIAYGSRTGAAGAPGPAASASASSVKYV
jgi:hypothetical protein